MSNPLRSAFHFAMAAAMRRPAPGRANRRRLSPSVFAGAVRAADALLLLAAGGLAWLAAATTGGDLAAALCAAAAVAVCLDRSGAYRVSRLVSLPAQGAWLALALAAGVAALLLAGTVLHAGSPPELAWVAVWLLANLVLLGAAHVAIARVATRLRGQGRLSRRVALLGATEMGRAFAAELAGHDDTDIDLVGIYDDAPVTSDLAPAAGGGLPFLGDVGQLVADGQRGRLDAVVIALPASEAGRVMALGDRLGHLVLDVFVATDLAARPFRFVSTLGGVPVGLLARRPLSDWQVVQKAAFDRTLAALLLLLFAPVLLLVALAIRLDSPGPLLFRQRRIGFGGRPFECLKFRTMHHHMADPLADRQVARGDPRVTRVGAWLRRLSLDEFPQLLNVLGGEMSLVGPRPHAPNSKAASRPFAEVVADYARRHRVKPGITGWAQVNGWRGETATEDEIEQRVRHDLYYIQNWSLAWDVRILLLTAWRMCADPQAF
jgi:Undecaprenyl-phosphate glucose phosphotransferase